MLDTQQQYAPFKSFLTLTSFVASVGVALSISVAVTLACSTSFLGRSDDEAFASLRRSANVFTWSAAIHAVGLVSSLLTELMFTSPHFVAWIVEGPYVRIMRWIVGSLAWASLALVVAGVGLAAEGLKTINHVAGSIAQWALLVLGLPLLVMWVVLRSVLVAPSQL